MKRNFRFFLAVLVSVVLLGCDYDDSALWSEVDGIKGRLDSLEEAVEKHNDDIEALQTIVRALQAGVYVSDVVETDEGYTIHFSDGTQVTLNHGKDGVNAPLISVRLDDDGIYYWTLDGEYLLVDGERVRASGKDGDKGDKGDKGEDAIAPELRINEQTREWEISVDGGVTWTSTGVVAEGKDGVSGEGGTSLFTGVDASNDDYVVVTLADGTSLMLARYDATQPCFEVEGAEQLMYMEYGASISLAVDARNVADYVITEPHGWHVTYAEQELTVEAPAKDMCHYDKEVTIAITMVSAEGRSGITKIAARVGEWVERVTLRKLSFEDEDAQFTPYELAYCGRTISTWSDLVAEDQYMSSLIYDMSGSEPYYWFDEGNTFLAHTFPYNYFSYAYWGGGHAISSYASLDYETMGDYNNQLTVFGAEGMGGHDGSKNFCMHFGYKDDSGYNGTEELSSILFGDGVERVIDHLWVNNSTYALNSYLNGNGLTEPIGEGDMVWITATGYNLADEKVGESRFPLVDGIDGIVVEWTKWDLTSLGNVARVEFNMGGSSNNGYGFSQPAYFAYDDVAVRFSERVFE